MSAMHWADSLIVVGLIFLAFCVGFLIRTRPRKLFVPYSELNRYSPGCFQIGNDLKDIR